MMGCAEEGATFNQAMPVQGSAPASDGEESIADEGAGGEGAGEGEGESAALEEESSGSQAPCAVSFTKHLMPTLATKCGTAACHQQEFVPSIDSTTPQITYEGLLDFGFDDPDWIDPHPTDSGLAEPALKTAVDGWRQCGAPFE